MVSWDVEIGSSKVASPLFSYSGLICFAYFRVLQVEHEDNAGLFHVVPFAFVVKSCVTKVLCKSKR